MAKRPNSKTCSPTIRRTSNATSSASLTLPTVGNFLYHSATSSRRSFRTSVEISTAIPFFSCEFSWSKRTHKRIMGWHNYFLHELPTNRERTPLQVGRVHAIDAIIAKEQQGG